MAAIFVCVHWDTQENYVKVWINEHFYNFIFKNNNKRSNLSNFTFHKVVYANHLRVPGVKFYRRVASRAGWTL